MKATHLVSALALLLASPLPAPAQAPAAPAAAAAPTARLAELGDRAVVDATGAKVADVYDVVIDTEEARAAYLVVSVGMRVVPFAWPSPELAVGADRVVLMIDRARLAGAPALDMTALGPRYKRGRDMLGGDLRDQKDARIGEVKDFAFNLADGTIASVVVAFDPKAWDQPGWVALPRQSVQPRGRDFVATFSLDDMRPASQAAAEQRLRDAARAKAVAVDRDERMSQLVGQKIVDAQGKPVGDVADFAVDPVSGKMPYMLVNAGGAPLALALPSVQLKRAGDEIIVGNGAASLAAMPSAAGTMRASEILKRPLVDSRDKQVGRLKDFVVNLGSGKVHYAVAEFDGSWVAAGHLVTVRLPKDDMKIELNALMGAMIFDPSGWQASDLNNEQYLANIDKYLGKR